MKTIYRQIGVKDVDHVSERVFGLFVRMLRYLGVAGLDLSRTTGAGAAKYSVKGVSYFDGVPDSVRSVSEKHTDALVGMMLLIGISSLRIEMNDREMGIAERVWSGEGIPIDSSEGDVSLVSEDVEARAIYMSDALKSGKIESIDPVDENAVSSITGDDEAKIMAVYEAVAEMLPVEGRDYVLNPTVKEGGAVGFSPVAMTTAGKMWLDYLSVHLGEYMSGKSRNGQGPAEALPNGSETAHQDGNEK